MSYAAERIRMLAKLTLRRKVRAIVAWPLKPHNAIILCLLGAVIIAAMTTSCATYDYQWEKRHAPMQNIRIAIVADTDAVCKTVTTAMNGGRLIGCAHRDYAKRVCTIYLPADYPQWLLAHERRHCLTGEDHP